MSTAATPDQRRLYIREFLNTEREEDLGAVLAEISDGDQDQDYLDFGATLNLQEAGSEITLDFGVFGVAHTDEDRAELRQNLEAARLKAARLRGAVYLFLEKLDEALNDVETDLDNRDRNAQQKG